MGGECRKILPRCKVMQVKKEKREKGRDADAKRRFITRESGVGANEKGYKGGGRG